MALLVTLFLVLVNIFNNVTTNTPKAEGLTAIEAWMLACILFVFAALAEYAAILFHKMNLMIGNKKETKHTYEVGQPYYVQGGTMSFWKIFNFKLSLKLKFDISDGSTLPVLEL